MEGVRSIVLTHDTITGVREVSIDSQVVPGSRGTNTALGRPSTITFKVAGRKGALTIASQTTVFVYKCVVDGVALVERNMHWTVDSSYAAPNVTTAVVAGDIALDKDGDAVVWFRLRSTLSLEGHPRRTVVVHRRFKEFCALDEELKSSYKGSPFVSSFPPLPSRAIKFFQDHTKPEFVDGRCKGLTSYLGLVRRIPRMTALPHFTVFMGFADGALYERSQVFRDGPLGMTLLERCEGGDVYTQVSALKKSVNGSRGQAAAHGCVRVGDKISKINGESCLGVAHEVVVARLRTARRPMVVHFIGEEVPEHLACTDEPGSWLDSPLAMGGLLAILAVGAILLLRASTRVRVKHWHRRRW